MPHLTRINSYGETNPLPLRETADLTPEQKAEYTFILFNGEDEMLIPEMDARRISPLIEHMGIGDVFQILS